MAVALLPAVVGMAILVGWTVPLEFGAGLGLAIAAASGAPRPAVPAPSIHLW